MNRKMIEEKIKENGLKKNWVARQLEMHPATFRRFLKGQADIGSEKLIKLLEILNLNLEALTKAS